MVLADLWFILIGVLFAGYFFLEGFDYGVGILNPMIAKTDEDKRILLSTIGPVWGANEVWLLTAGGAMFAAFPNWYATLFSGFYLALFIILVGLIIRGVGLDFRNKVEHPVWRKTWDIGLFLGSALPALLFGVAMANLLKGVPIDQNMEYAGGFFDLLSPFTLVAGVLSLCFFSYLGALYLSLKVTGDLEKKAVTTLKILWPVNLILAIVILGMALYAGYFALGSIAFYVSMASLLLYGLSYFMISKHSLGTSMVLASLVVVLGTAALFIALYPNVMVSSLNPQFNLTTTNASSSPYTLKIMTYVTITLLPIALGYQIWNYRIFKKRMTANDLHY